MLPVLREQLKVINNPQPVHVSALEKNTATQRLAPR